MGENGLLDPAEEGEGGTNGENSTNKSVHSLSHV